MSHPHTIDKYQIIEHLGSGSFGDVYRVLDRALQVEKAIKVLGVTDPAEFIQSLEEGQILRRCSHKHIVAINEANIFNVKGSPRVVLDLEYIPEGSLEDALKNRWVSIQEAVRYLQGALHGLEHAHSHGFLHRDIKPGNILLGHSISKLSDFGLATDTSATLIGSAQGYVTHLPPEYWTTRRTTVLTDVFACGVTLYRAVSNIDDWRAVVKAAPNARAKIQNGKLIESIGFESFIPKALQRLIRKACHPDPAKRYQSVLELRQQLDRLRFGIDWIATGDFSWEGRQGSDVLSIEVDPMTFALTYKKKNRRKNDQCAQYGDLGAAIQAMEEQIAETTLQ